MELINTWLDTPTYSDFSINRYVSKSKDIRNYYLETDKELNINFLDLYEKGDQTYNDLLNRYNKEIILTINSNTKRYEADTIFRRLIDFTTINSINDDNDIPLINPNMRESFYKFIYSYT